MAVIKGIAVVWGVHPPKPIVNLPRDAVKVRLRLRCDNVGLAFVKFKDRIEKWVLQPADEETIAHPHWKLGWLQGVNAIR